MLFAHAYLSDWFTQLTSILIRVSKILDTDGWIAFVRNDNTNIVFLIPKGPTNNIHPLINILLKTLKTSTHSMIMTCCFETQPEARLNTIMWYSTRYHHHLLCPYALCIVRTVYSIVNMTQDPVVACGNVVLTHTSVWNIRYGCTQLHTTSNRVCNILRCQGHHRTYDRGPHWYYGDGSRTFCTAQMFLLTISSSCVTMEMQRESGHARAHTHTRSITHCSRRLDSSHISEAWVDRQVSRATSSWN